MDSAEQFDFCVIGTGAGGGVMIDRLTAAGFSVVALERGPRLEPAALDEDELRTVFRDEVFSPQQLETYRFAEGEPTIRGRFNSLAHCVGGTMLHWSAISWRYRPDEFRLLTTEGAVPGASLADWPLEYAEMEPYYELAEREFGVAGDAWANPFGAPRRRNYPNPPVSQRAGSAHLMRSVRRLGYRSFPTPLAINTRSYGGRPQCMYGGTCGNFACPIGAKGTTFAVSLPRALATGRLDLRPDARAVEIVHRGGRVRAVRYLDAARREMEVAARHVVVSCGSIGTPHLLLLSTSGSHPGGLANSSGQVGRNITFHHRAGVTFTLERPTMSMGGLESHAAIDDLHASDPRRGFIRGGVITENNSRTRLPLSWALVGHDGYAAATGRRSWGSDLRRFLESFPRSMSLLAYLEDLPMEANCVDLDPVVKDSHGLPVPRITHRQHPNDLAMNRWFSARLLEIADACGASEKWVSTALTDQRSAMRGAPHVLGTCRMGNDPTRSVVNRWCRAHDVPNLWIVDGSVFPNPGGYNPTLTILANAYRVAAHMVSEARKGNLA